jgi:NADH-quinone oxidoreductase subunit H
MLASQFAGPAGTTIAALVHVGVFLGKSALLLFLWLRVRERLPRLTDARALALCWKLLIPLALLNLLVTGAVILRQAEGSPT